MRSRTLIPAIAAVVCFAGWMSAAPAEVSMSFSFGTEVGFDPCDDDMDCDNIIVINDNEIGYWIQLPSGRWVLRSRPMWFNIALDEWCYGPWTFNYSVNHVCLCHGPRHSYCPYHGIRYITYMQTNYPHRRYYYGNGPYRVNREYRYHDGNRPHRVDQVYDHRPVRKEVRVERVVPLLPLPVPPSVLRKSSSDAPRVIEHTQRTATVQKRTIEQNRPEVRQQSDQRIRRTGPTRTR